MNFFKLKLSSLLVVGTLLLGTSCVDNDGNGETRQNIEIEGINGPKLVLQDDKVVINTIFKDIQVEGELTYLVPSFQNSTINLSKDPVSGGTLFAVNIAIADVLGDITSILSPQTLPGGRPLPGIGAGTLPAAAFTIESWNNVRVYVGKETFGIFYPFDLDVEGAIGTFRFYSGEKRTGNISLVGKDQNGENSGVLLLLEMNATTKKLLKQRALEFGHVLD